MTKDSKKKRTVIFLRFTQQEWKISDFDFYSKVNADTGDSFDQKRDYILSVFPTWV